MSARIPLLSKLLKGSNITRVESIKYIEWNENELYLKMVAPSLHARRTSPHAWLKPCVARSLVKILFWRGFRLISFSRACP